jgi:hypothetical protein
VLPERQVILELTDTVVVQETEPASMSISRPQLRHAKHEQGVIDVKRNHGVGKLSASAGRRQTILVNPILHCGEIYEAQAEERFGDSKVMRQLKHVRQRPRRLPPK